MAGLPVSIPGEIDIVYYHGACSDGAASAWVYRQWLIKNDKDLSSVQFVQVFHGKSPPDVKGKRIAIFDFSWKLDQMTTIMEDCASFILIDHHKTAYEELFIKKIEMIIDQAQKEANKDFGEKRPILTEKALERLKDLFKGKIIIDMEHCGCILVWKWLYGNLDDLPKFLGLIEDRDLWKWELKDSKEFSTGTFYDPDIEWSEIFDYYDKLYKGGNEAIEKIIEKGHEYLIPINKEVDRMARASKYFYWKTEKLRVQCVNTRFSYSEVANTILENNPRSNIACVWFYDQWDRVFKFKLRSRIEDEEEDVSRIASAFGGGGHKSSASFQLDPDSPIVLDWIKGELIELSCYVDMIQSNKKRKLKCN